MRNASWFSKTGKIKKVYRIEEERDAAQELKLLPAVEED
jgi:hypothetical protein